MEFNVDYTPATPEAWPSAPLGVPDNRMPRAPADEKGNNPLDLSVRDIGMSVPFGIAAGNVEGIQAKIRGGAGHLELQFPGGGGGNRQSQVPGMYGKEQRQALREISKINDVAFTTHASFGVTGASGADQQGNLNLAQGKLAYDEIARAIDFAKDVADGGSVTVHVGEFNRPLTHIFNQGNFEDESKNLARDKNGRLMFQQHPFQAEKAQFLLVDDRTGQGFQTVQADRKAAQPVWRTAKKNYYYTDEMGRQIHVKKGDYIDYENRIIEDPYAIRFEHGLSPRFEGGRVPEIDESNGRFKFEMKTLKDFKSEAAEYNKYFSKLMGRNPDNYESMTAREMYMKSTLWTRAGYAHGWALNFSTEVPQLIEKLKKLEKIKKFYDNLEADVPEEDKWKLMRTDARVRSHTHDLIPVGTEMPSKILEEDIKETRLRLEYAWQSGNTQELEAADQFETMRHLKTPEKYFQKHGVNYYAMAGIDALQASKDTKKPVVMTLEHIAPEQFGGHPEELKWIIDKARDKMVELLISPKIEGHGQYDQIMQEAAKKLPPGEYQKGLNPFYRQNVTEEQARKLAETHIKATIDTGHLNMWRKYYIDDPKKTKEQNTKEFNKWMVGQMDKLAQKGYIGNVHLSDNYGFHDTHLAPGQGNAPIKEIVGKIKNSGYKERIIVEPGADATTDNSDMHGLMKTWRHFGANIYASGSGGGTAVGAPPPAFADVQYSYFGRSYPPNFIFGGYSPSNDWTLWSGVQME